MTDPAGAHLHIAFWNTWLLAPRLWATGPRLPGGKRMFFAPDVEERAPLVGPALAGRFDVAALAEVFEHSEQGAVAASWPGSERAIGPHRRGARSTGSGLMTLADRSRTTITRIQRLAYRSGGDWRDADTFATKGALLTSLRLTDTATGEPADDLPEIELVSTHLLAGGDLLPVPGARDQRRHHEARMRQVDELLDWMEAVHRPGNIVMLVGDFNVPAHDPDPALGDPTSRYQDLVDRVARHDLHDLWAAHGVGPGHTCTFDRPSDLPADPEHPDRVLDHADHQASTAPGERIDYLFLARPDDPDVTITVEHPRRWAFHGRPAQGGPAGSLSDHLAVSVRLDVARSGT